MGASDIDQASKTIILASVKLVHTFAYTPPLWSPAQQLKRNKARRNKNLILFIFFSSIPL
jgi:hypothetical protein